MLHIVTEVPCAELDDDECASGLTLQEHISVLVILALGVCNYYLLGLGGTVAEVVVKHFEEEFGDCTVNKPD